MWALASDPVLKRQIAEVVVDIKDAKRRIDRRRHRRLRVITGVLVVGSVAALAAPLVRRAISSSTPVGTSTGGGKTA